MTDLRKAAQQALEAMDDISSFDRWFDAREALRDALENQFNPDWDRTEALQESLREHMAEIHRLRAALAEPQSTHSADCYKWHHECAIARIEETEELREALKAELERTLTDEQISDLWHQSGEQPFKFARMLLK